MWSKAEVMVFIASYYRRQPDEVDEDDKLVIDAEDPYHELDGEGNTNDGDIEMGDDADGASGSNANDKPIRELYEFYIFDPKHNNELVTLEALEQDDGVDRWFEAVGRVKAHLLSSEDDGQEDELDGDAMETREGGKRDEVRKIHLSSILRCTVDFTKESE
jgi:DNA (cytosine-5)-methyltransferase 1